MELSVLDRLILLNVLPKEADLTTLKVVRKLQEELSFTEEEHQILQFRQEDERLLWNEMDDKEIEIGEKATDVIVDAFKKLNRQGQLKLEYIDLYEKFVKE